MWVQIPPRAYQNFLKVKQVVFRGDSMSLIVRSKIKAAIKGMRFAGDFYNALDKKVEDIDMIAAGGFDADDDVLWVAGGLQVSQDFVKFFFGLEESFFAKDFFLCVKGTEVQGIKGCIYAEKIFIFRHGLTSFFALNGLKNGNSMLSLPSSRVIRDRCPNQLIRNGESGGRTPSRALGPGFNSSPCFQSLSSISSIIIPELYPNST
mgnify:CR=1 FL=1